MNTMITTCLGLTVISIVQQIVGIREIDSNQGQPVTHGNWSDLVGYFHGDGSEASGVFSSEELHLDGYITATKN